MERRYTRLETESGMGTNVRRRGRGNHIPIGRQCRVVEGARIVHRRWDTGPDEAFFPHRRRWRGHSLLLLGEGKLGHLGTERFGRLVTAGGGENEMRAVTGSRMMPRGIAQ